MGALGCFGDNDTLLTPDLLSGASPQIKTPSSLLLRDSTGEIKGGNSGCQVFSSYGATRERKGVGETLKANSMTSRTQVTRHQLSQEGQVGKEV